MMLENIYRLRDYEALIFKAKVEKDIEIKDQKRFNNITMFFENDKFKDTWASRTSPKK